MPYSKCPHCGGVHKVETRVMGQAIGCQRSGCGKIFQAIDYRIHSGPMSKMVFYGVIAFSIFIAFWYIQRSHPEVMPWL